MRFFRAFPSVVRQMPGFNSPRLGTARTSHFNFSFVLLCMFCSLYFLYCLCVSVAALLPPGVNPFAVKHIYIYIYNNNNNNNNIFASNKKVS